MENVWPPMCALAPRRRLRSLPPGDSLRARRGVGGDDQGSATYVRAKLRDCEQCGIPSRDFKLPEQTTQDELMELVRTLNDDPGIAGILVQMPLPRHLDAEAVVAAIDPTKDVDGFHPENLGRLVRGLPGLRPCTPAGIMEMLDAYGIDPAGKNAVIVGRSSIVGKPMSLMLLAQNATISVAHSHTDPRARPHLPERGHSRSRLRHPQDDQGSVDQARRRGHRRRNGSR